MDGNQMTLHILSNIQNRAIADWYQIYFFHLDNNFGWLVSVKINMSHYTSLPAELSLGIAINHRICSLFGPSAPKSRSEPKEATHMHNF